MKIYIEVALIVNNGDCEFNNTFFSKRSLPPRAPQMEIRQLMANFRVLKLVQFNHGQSTIETFNQLYKLT